MRLFDDFAGRDLVELDSLMGHCGSRRGFLGMQWRSQRSIRTATKLKAIHMAKDAQRGAEELEIRRGRHAP